MYGLVNKAVQEFVIESQGEKIWKKIKEKAGVEHETFNTMQSYDDSITYNIVGAASEVLSLSPEDVLFEFGKYWVVFASKQEGHSHYFKLGKRGLFGFLCNLDRMHLNISRTFSKLSPPSFECRELGNGQLELKYFSERLGLRPFVKGLLTGISIMFKLNLDIKIDPRSDEELGGYALFYIQE